MKTVFLITGFFFLFLIEIGKVYLIMPFPGSQKQNTIDLAYWLDQNIWWLRMMCVALLAYPIISVFGTSRTWKKVVTATVLILYGVVFYYTNFRFLADKMFLQPRTKELYSGDQNKVDSNKLVIAVTLNGEARAYPIEIIGYHHQVIDTVGQVPVMVTYCTVCRTGRVYSPAVDGKQEKFRLVGMDHFNAMFEDATTKSWWRQVTGTAIVGPLKGKSLKEIPSRQLTLAAWQREYPQSLVLQPDTMFNKRYADLEGFDKGTVESGLEKRDSASWKLKSWVVGVVAGNTSKAYDWNELVATKMIQDSLPDSPLVLLLGSDTASFYVFDRRMDGMALNFQQDSIPDFFRDTNTNSAWNISGFCVDGPFNGRQLHTIQAYQEFWHSWKTFHPQTLQYRRASSQPIGMR